jgi:hypothetical protein
MSKAAGGTDSSGRIMTNLDLGAPAPFTQARLLHVHVRPDALAGQSAERPGQTDWDWDDDIQEDVENGVPVFTELLAGSRFSSSWSESRCRRTVFTETLPSELELWRHLEAGFLPLRPLQCAVLASSARSLQASDRALPGNGLPGPRGRKLEQAIWDLDHVAGRRGLFFCEEEEL